jgi:hypothetical protein
MTDRSSPPARDPAGFGETRQSPAHAGTARTRLVLSPTATTIVAPLAITLRGLV